MARAKRPVTIAGIEFDALISEEHGYEATVPEYAVESGFSVSDAIIHGAETLNMVLYVTDTPVTWRSHSGAAVLSRSRSGWRSCTTPPSRSQSSPATATYTSMAIENLTISKSAEVGYARETQFRSARFALRRRGRRPSPPATARAVRPPLLQARPTRPAGAADAQAPVAPVRVLALVAALVAALATASRASSMVPQSQSA